MISTKEQDLLFPVEAVLADDAFWLDYQKAIAKAVVPKFVEIFRAGWLTGLRVRPVRKAAGEAEAELSEEQIILAEAERVIRDYVPTFTHNIAQTTYDRVREAVIATRNNTGTVEEVMNRIAPLFGPERSEMIAVTETTRLFGMGAQASYRVQGFTAWRWMTVNDPWVDPVCGGLQDELFPMDKLFEPAHPRCRCFPSPEIMPEKKPEAIPEGIPEGGFATTREAEVWLQLRNKNKTIDFTGIPPEVANVAVRQFDELSRNFPGAWDHLRIITTRPEQFPATMTPFENMLFGSNVYAYVQSGKYMALNLKWFGNPTGFKNSLLAGVIPNVWGVPFHPVGGDTIESVIAHEFGHVVQDWMHSRRHNMLTSAADIMGRGTVGKFLDDFAETWLSPTNSHLQSLSRYALTNPNEAFAEAFAQWRMQETAFPPYDLNRVSEMVAKLVPQVSESTPIERTADIPFIVDIFDLEARGLAREEIERLYSDYGMVLSDEEMAQ